MPYPWDINDRVTPEEFFGPGVDTSNLPLGMRLSNNPFNIKYTNTPYQRKNFLGMEGPSEARDQGDPQIRFTNPLAGVASGLRLALTKQTQGLKTVRQLISHPTIGWTPRNNGAALNIARTMGVSPDEPINLRDPVTAQKWARALIAQEHGESGGLYNDDLIRRGVDIALGGGGAPSPLTRLATPADPGATPDTPPFPVGASAAPRSPAPPTPAGSQPMPLPPSSYSGMSPENVAYNRQLALRLMDAGRTGEVRHPLQAIGNALTMGIGAWRGDVANQGEREGRAAAYGPITDALRGKGDPNEAIARALSSGGYGQEVAGPYAQSILQNRIQEQSPLGKLNLRGKEAEVDVAEAKAAEIKDPMGAYRRRAEIAQAHGLKQGTREWKEFVLTGTLKTPEYDLKEVGGKIVAVPKGAPAESHVVYSGDDPNAAKNIAGGIQELASIPERFDAFGNAVGTFRGADNWANPLGHLGRVWGSFTSLVEGTGKSPSEVRSAIDGSVQALSNAIKPLIRKPGEGTWGIIDQEKLESIVGNLKLANNKEEYKRRLEEVKRRIEANFNLKLPDVPGLDTKSTMGNAPISGAAGASGIPVLTPEEARQQPPGTLFRTPDGRILRVGQPVAGRPGGL